MNSGWQKVLSDGSTIDGSDLAVDSKLTSWRKTSQEITSVLITDNSLIAAVSGQGSWWQSDDYQVPFVPNSTSVGTRTKRRIQKQILSTDKYLYLHQTDSRLDIFVEDEIVIKYGRHYYTRSLLEQHIGMWLTVEIDINARSINWYMNKVRI